MDANASSVLTWKDPWVPDLGSYRPQPHASLPTFDPESLVQSFIIPHSYLWNKALVEKTFHPDSAKISRAADRLAWAPETTGVFLVKSAYRLLLMEDNSLLNQSPTVDWQSLWKLNMQERLKFFLWKVAWDALPSRQKIAEKLQANFQGEEICPLCGNSSESLPHLFFFCSFARLLRRSSPWPISVDIVTSGSIHHWLRMLLNPSRFLYIPDSDSHHFQLFAALTMDSIWRARN